MKKILTVLLSFFMVATLGIVNVSAEDYSFDENYKTQTLEYYGQDIYVGSLTSSVSYESGGNTLYKLKCKDESCVFYYAISTSDSTSAEVLWKPYTGNDVVSVNATNAGTYYLHLSKNNTHNVLNKDNQDEGYGITIGKASATLTINVPTATWKDQDGSNYYLVTAESGDVVLPFTVTSDPNVGTSWNDATVSAVTSTGVTYTTGISFDKTNGNLTIDADNTDLHEGRYAVKLSATSNDSNYDGSAEKTIYVLKVGSKDFDINLKSDEKFVVENNNVVYGVNASQIIGHIESISFEDGTTVAPVEGKTTISSAKVEKLVNGNYQEILNDQVLPVNDSDDFYRITATITQTLADGNSYTFTASDNFKVVRKAASADVDFKTGLVYDGTERVLATASNALPTGDGTHTEGASVLFKVSDKAGDPQTVYESLNEIAVAEPKRKDAGTYYVYYYINHGTNDNYEDYYGMETVTIDKAPLTVTGLDDKTIIYDGNRHEPNFVVDGFVNGEEPFDLKVFNPTEQARRYKGVGDWTVKVKLPSNVDEGQADPKNYTLVDSEGTHVDELSATLTINQATATVDKSASTSIYYKNNKGTATIKSNGLSGDFKSLWIKNSEGEWKEVDDELYTVSENGPTVIVLKEEYLQSLTDNKETFEIGKDYEFALKFSDNYTNDPIATTTLQVRKYTAPASDSSSSSSTTTTTAKKVVNTSAN